MINSEIYNAAMLQAKKERSEAIGGFIFSVAGWVKRLFLGPR